MRDPKKAKNGGNIIARYILGGGGGGVRRGKGNLIYPFKRL
jgi:hypothetical protein